MQIIKFTFMAKLKDIYSVIIKATCRIAEFSISLAKYLVTKVITKMTSKMVIYQNNIKTAVGHDMWLLVPT